MTLKALWHAIVGDQRAPTSPFEQQYAWEVDFAKNQPSGVECQIPGCTGNTNWGWCSKHTPMHYRELP